MTTTRTTTLGGRQRSCTTELFGSLREMSDEIERRRMLPAPDVDETIPQRYFIGAPAGDKDHPYAERELDAWHGADKDIRDWKSAREALFCPTDEMIRKLGLLHVPAIRKKDGISWKTGVAGAFPCVPNAIQGLPASMYRPVRNRPRRKTATLIVLPNANCGTSPQDLAEAAWRILQYAYRTESEGTRLSIWSGMFSLGVRRQPDGKMHDYIMLAKVKDFDTAFNPSRLAFPLASPAFFRVFCFNAQLTCPQMRVEKCLGSTPRRDDFPGNDWRPGYLAQTIPWIDEKSCKVVSALDIIRGQSDL